MNKDTMADAGYIYAGFDKKRRLHVLQRVVDGKREYWAANKNHASYGIIFRNTHLEFCGSVIAEQ